MTANPKPFATPRRYHNGPAVPEGFVSGWAIASGRQGRRAHFWRYSGSDPAAALPFSDCGIEYVPTRWTPLVEPGDARLCAHCIAAQRGSPQRALERNHGPDSARPLLGGRRKR